MKISEVSLNDAVLEQLLSLSADWEGENSCYGYHKNGPEDIAGNRIFLAKEGTEAIGYLLGHRASAERSSSVMDQGTAYFEVEELYVKPRFRSRGVGRALFDCAETAARREGLEYLLLTTPTKNYSRVLHFYIEELGMEFWSARLYKKL